jgi:uncharacterized protein (DUF1697 family)
MYCRYPEYRVSGEGQSARMPTYISMLRGINVSGQKKIKMTDLRDLYESLGFDSVQTYIQSGNVVFHSKLADTRKIEKAVSGAILKQYKFDVPVMVRSVKEMNRVVSGNPLLKDNRRDVSKLHVTFLSGKPKALLVKNLEAPVAGDEALQILGSEVFVYCPHGYGKTKLNNSFFENKLSVVATTRNWKTVNVLLEMAKQNTN